jgi:CxxC motif-containing protein (DUF1111 family)
MKAHRKLFIVSLILPASLVLASCSRDDAPAAGDEPLDPGTAVTAQEEGTGVHTAAITEALTGFDNKTNGFLSQADFDIALDLNQAGFSEVEANGDGLGPVYNAQSCRECHQNPVIGGGSQTSEFRAGHNNNGTFVEHPGGSLINERAIDVSLQERLAAGQEVRSFRLSLSLLGDGYIEAIDSNTLAAIAAAQPAGQRGTLPQVPVLESGNAPRAGRFGWKSQQASLLSFAADAYVNEMGITSPLQPAENTSLGNSVARFDLVGDPEDLDGDDIALFAGFMRALKAPPRGPAVGASARGETLFRSATLGCAICHVPDIVTAPAGTVINQGAFTVPPSLGDKRIHPFGDFLLHNVGSGDGIVQNAGQSSANQIRTPPLWGVRARDRLMHDGLTVSRGDAIRRHGGPGSQAIGSVNAFNALSAADQQAVIDFLNTL